MSAWFAVGVEVKPNTRNAVLIVSDAIDLFRVAIADRGELPKVLKLFLPRERHHPRVSVEPPTLVRISRELFRPRVPFVAWNPSPRRLK
jgi:hypothetical protein